MRALIGKVVDKNTGKGIYNAHVVFTDASGNYGSPTMGTVTDFEGNYQFETLGGQFVTASHVSYKKMIKQIDFSNFQSGGDYSQVINFSLDGSGFNLPEVIITPKTKQWVTRNSRALALSLAALGFFGWVMLREK